MQIEKLPTINRSDAKMPRKYSENFAFQIFLII